MKSHVVALGFDVGSGGTRAALVDARGRTLAARSGPPRNRAWWTQVTAEDLFDEMAGLAKGLLADLAERPDIRSIGVGALGPTPVPVDGAMRSLFPLSPYSLDPADLGVRRRRGSRADTDDPWLKLLRWRKTERSTWRRVASVVDLTGYLVGRLIGRPIMDTVTAADYRRASREGVPLPVAVDPLTVVGTLDRNGAGALGLSVGIPVVAGTYDSYVDLFGAGVRRAGARGVVLGSTLVVALAIDEPGEAIAPPGLRLVDGPGGCWLVAGWTSAAGLALEWARRKLGLDPVGPSLLAEVGRLIPGEAGLLALPYLAGERSPVWDPSARGALVGLRLGTTRLEIYRAFLDAVALSALDLADRLEEERPDRGAWRATGGGVWDAAWLTATVDALGTPLLTIAAPPGAAAAVVAWRGVGVEVELPVDRRLEPDLARHARYRSLLPLYRDLHRRLRPVVRSLASASTPRRES